MLFAMRDPHGSFLQYIPLEDAQAHDLKWMTAKNRIAYEAKPMSKPFKYKTLAPSISDEKVLWSNPYQESYDPKDRNIEWGVFNGEYQNDIFLFTQVVKDPYTVKVLLSLENFQSYHNTNITGKSVRLDFKEPLKAGDHIYIILHDPVIYEHHGIYIGNDRVIHFQNFITTTHIIEFCKNLVIRKK